MSSFLDQQTFHQIVEAQLDVILPMEVTGQERLRDELQLDSMRLLQLLVHLELEYGLVLADEQLGQLPQMTVEMFLAALTKKEVL
ncbi:MULTISPECIES: phosphopantetheine-binding protein [unclassified Exiguobacterium]|uniref:phosphopantetheine-binding protein n=1 Tax=unclassified Exiguobacterium TaxID=2644629 RepID=UPI001BEC62C6|nr:MULTISPECIES: phosphopantetheine-binding protein [unclassified Exiguobacterium]